MTAEPLFLADTNLCIDLLVGRSARAADRFSRCVEGEVVTSAIVHAEVMIGVQRAGADPASVAAVTVLFSLVPVLPFDRECSGAYASLPFRRRSYDRLIAAHALALGLILVTSNERDFADIPGLVVENWAR